MRVHVGVRTPLPGGSGGLERAAEDQIDALLGAGVDVCLHAPGDGGRPACVVPWPGWNNGPGSPTFGMAYRRWMSRLSASIDACWRRGDAIYLHGASAGALPGLQYADPASAVVNPHGMEEFGPRSLLREVNRAPLRTAARRGVPLAHAVIATDDCLVPVVNANFPRRRRTVVIPNAVDVTRLDALAATSPSTSDAVRNSVVSVGRLVQNKGYDLLARAVAGIGSAADPLEWSHFGDGAEADTLYELVGRSPGVRWTHHRSAPDGVVQSALAGCRLFVQPSRYEGSGLAVLEAMARGAVVVATPVGGIPDKIRDGHSGYLADAPTATALADAIRRALASRDRSTVGARARATVVERFDVAAQTRSYVALFERARAT